MSFDLTCVILVGGQGTRLLPVVSDVPKPMAVVNGRPFLEYLLAQVCKAGFTDVLLCLGHKAEAIKNHFGDGSGYGIKIRYSREKELLGTAGALALARPLICSDPFLVMNGDSYCNVDFEVLIKQHRMRGAVATIVTSWLDSQARYGSVVLDAQNDIVAFCEKGESTGSGYINGGIYVLDQTVLDLIPCGQYCSIERDIFPELAGKGLYAFKTSGMFIDIGVPAELERAQTMFMDYLN